MYCISLVYDKLEDPHTIEAIWMQPDKSFCPNHNHLLTFAFICNFVTCHRLSHVQAAKSPLLIQDSIKTTSSRRNWWSGLVTVYHSFFIAIQKHMVSKIARARSRRKGNMKCIYMKAKTKHSTRVCLSI